MSCDGCGIRNWLHPNACAKLIIGEESNEIVCMGTQMSFSRFSKG